MALAASGDAVEAKGDRAAECQQVAHCHARREMWLKARHHRDARDCYQRPQPFAPIHAFAQPPRREERDKDGRGIGNCQAVGNGGVVERCDIAAKMQRGDEAKARKARPIARRWQDFLARPGDAQNQYPRTQHAPGADLKGTEACGGPTREDRTRTEKEYGNCDQIQPARFTRRGRLLLHRCLD